MHQTHIDNGNHIATNLLDKQKEAKEEKQNYNYNCYCKYIARRHRLLQLMMLTKLI